MNPQYTILVNTCDKFDDCWMPFFQLMKKNWQNLNAPILLNTEYKTFTYEGLEIKSAQVCLKNNCQSGRKASWGQCLKWAIDQIETDLILYMQEDYFLKSRVDDYQINRLVQMLTDNRQIKCLHLTDQAVKADTPSEFEKLNIVNRKQPYRVSCQAAIWRKDELLKLISVRESGWQFEKYASKRSSLIGNLYLAVDKSWVRLNQYEIIPYVFTGIIQGKWKQEAVDLMKHESINIDFSKRGILKGKEKKTLLRKIKYRINDIFCSLNNMMLMLKLKS